MDLELSQKLTQTLTPQLIQQMEILQMDLQELSEHIENALLENPVLEENGIGAGLEEYTRLKRELTWLEDTDSQNMTYNRDDNEDTSADYSYIIGTEEEPETLTEHLIAQLDSMDFDPVYRPVVEFIINSLDDNGWLRDDLDDLAAQFADDWTVEANAEEVQKEGQIPQLNPSHEALTEIFRKALLVVQHLEPAGIGARSLSECLMLQLDRWYPENSVAKEIVSEHLELQAQSKYGVIAEKVGCSREDVRAACELIRSLNPRPGQSYSASEPPAYINPDILVKIEDGEPEIVYNDFFLPTLSLSNYYVRMMTDNPDNEEIHSYLTGKVRQARWMIDAIESRRETLIHCAEIIVKEQSNFFKNGVGYLAPLKLADVAEKADVHESTVSRAIHGKYIQCAWGTFPISYFFSRKLGRAAKKIANESEIGADRSMSEPISYQDKNESISAQNIDASILSGQESEQDISVDRVKAMIRKLIDGEDKKKPLSDQKLCDRLTSDGIEISRRTVAKYREQMNIPNTVDRRL